MQFCQLFYYYLGSGKLTIGDFSSEQLLHDFDEAHMAFGQVSARARERERDKQGSVKRVVIFAFRSTNDEKRERSRNSSLGRGQAGRKIFATFCF